MSSYLESQRDPLTVSRHFCIFLFILCIARCWLKDVGWGKRIFFRANGYFLFFNLGATFVLCPTRAHTLSAKKAGGRDIRRDARSVRRGAARVAHLEIDGGGGVEGGRGRKGFSIFAHAPTPRKSQNL